MFTIKNFFLKVISTTNAKNEEDAQQRKQLNAILLMVFFATIFIFIGILITDALSTKALDQQTLLIYPVSLFSIVVVSSLYILNRYLSGTLAATLLVFLLIIVVTFSDTLEAVAFGRSLIAFTLPIILAGMVLQPLYSYLAAGLCSIILFVISVGVLKEPMPNIPAIAFFFMLAWISHNSSRGLKDALKNVTLSKQKLQESEVQYRGVFDGVNDAIIVETLSGEVLDANERACNMFGWSRQEFLKKTAKDMVLPDFLPLLPNEQNKYTLPKETFESVNMRANGERFPVAVRGRIETIGNEQRLLVVVRDITKEKDEERELVKAKEAAEAAAQAKTDFLANMSHEIRTPLNAIYGMTALMLDTPLNEEQQDFIETIRGGSDTLLKVINDILDFSKIEAGKMEFEMQPFYLRNCIEDALDLLAEDAVSKMLNLAYFIEEDVPAAVFGDVTRLRQILVNLLNNAIKFTDKGDVVVNLKARLVGNNQHELTFSVRDTGIGIPEDKVEKLFKSFSQVDTSTTRKYGGTGLGLAISKELAEKMGGTIWVESEEGKGSTFYFTILADVHSDAEPIIIDGVRTHLVGKRILIVDNNATNRLILFKQTTYWGMQPSAVGSGAEALALMQDGESFDIAILDMQLPEMGGFVLAQKINEMTLGDSLPVIILTSIKREKARSGYIKIAAYLSKPIKLFDLYTTLTSAVESVPARENKKKKEINIDHTMAKQHPLRILLAEDNIINQKVASKLLSRLGYRVDLAGNGIEAIEALERQTYDVVLMDIQMPKMDGDEATQRIRAKWSADRQPYIVAMTANALEGDRDKYIQRGMDDYVSKPVSIEALIAALEKAKTID